MENVNTLKELAMGAANNQVGVYSAPNVESELPTAEEMTRKSIGSGVAFVDDTPVIIAPPTKRTEPKVAEAMHTNSPVTELMNTPSPIPTAVGIEDATLNTPAMLFNLAADNSKNPAQNYWVEGISEEHLSMLEELMPELTEKERVEMARPILNTESSIIKDLIMNMGFTPEEAKISATNQIRKKITDKYTEEKNAAASTAVVTIDKTADPNDLGLTKDEHQKLEKVKKVRLVVVEDVELANIKIERPDEDHKADYVKSIEGSLSKYSVPMPMLGDFVNFRGAQLVQMVSIVNYEDARIDEIINTKASLIYEKIIGGSILQKYDSTGKIIMSYQEFANKFAYQDIDMALYGILCASSMEENTTSLTCQSCSHQWMQNYNLKSLLKLENISPEFKERVDEILKNKSNDIEMRKLFENMRKASRFKSPFTNNIYDLSYPSIARATNLLKRIDPEDTVMAYLSAVALYLSRILIYNEAKGTYVEINADETPLLLETMKSLSNEDVNMLAKQIRDDLYYAPQFILPAVCPSCGKKSEIPVSVEDLIFLIARDSMVEIDN